MATRSGGKELENGIQVALDAADTASGVTEEFNNVREQFEVCLLYTSPSPRDRQKSRMPSSA